MLVVLYFNLHVLQCFKTVPKYQLRYIGQTFDSGESTDDEPQSASEKLKRAWEDSIGSHDDLDARMGAEDTAYRPEDDGLYDSTSFRDSLKNSLKKQAAAFADFFKTALFSNDGYKHFLVKE